MVAGSEAVHVISHTGANLAPTQKPLSAVEIVRGGYLKIVFAARHQSDGKASLFGDGGIIGHLQARRRLVGGQNFSVAEPLRRLDTPKAGSIDRLIDNAVGDRFQRISHGNCRHSTAMTVQPRQHALYKSVVNKRPGGVMDENAVRRLGLEVTQAPQHGFLAAIAAANRRHDIKPFCRRFKQ